MRNLLAVFFRLLFRIPFLKGTFFGFHKRFFKPYNIYSGLIKTVSFGNLRINLHIDDWIQQNIYFLGTYEGAELKVLNEHLSENSAFIDIGANFGLYSLSASKKITNSGKIICFEPYPENYQALMKNISINNLSKIITENKAVGDSQGKLKLYYQPNENNLGMVSASYIENSVVHEVEVISLDKYLETQPLNKIDLIKIDVEGFEYHVLSGMKKTLSTYSPKILIEIFDVDDSNIDGQKAHDFLTQMGYTKHFIDDNGKLSNKNMNTNRKNYFYQK